MEYAIDYRRFSAFTEIYINGGKSLTPMVKFDLDVVISLYECTPPRCTAF